MEVVLFIIFFYLVIIVMMLIYVLREAKRHEKIWEDIVKRRSENMNKLLIFLMVFLSIESYCQQHLSIKYLWNNNELEVTNYQPCKVDVEIDYNSVASILTIDPERTDTISLPGTVIPGSTVRFRSKENCLQGAHAGWLRYTIPETLALKVEKFSAKQNYNSILLSFRVHVPENEDFKIEKSPDGVNWQTVYKFNSINPTVINDQWTDHKPSLYNFYRIDKEIVFALYEPKLYAWIVYSGTGQYMSQLKLPDKKKVIALLNPGRYLLWDGLKMHHVFKTN